SAWMWGAGNGKVFTKITDSGFGFWRSVFDANRICFLLAWLDGKHTRANVAYAFGRKTFELSPVSEMFADGRDGIETVIATGEDGAAAIRVWDLVDGKSRVVFREKGRIVSSIAVSDDGRDIVAAHHAASELNQTNANALAIGIWDMRTGRARSSFTIEG